MKKTLLVGLLGLSMASCRFTSGSGDIVTSTRNTGSFSGVSAGGGFEVEIRTGSPHKVVVEADDNLLEDVETSVEGGRLRIRMKKGVNARHAHLKVFITAPSITNLQSSASADINVIGTLSSDKTIVVNASSGSSIKADLDAPAVEADASSGSQIDLTGRTRSFDGQSSSGASIDAEELLSENTRAETSSGASLHVHASVELNAKASSGGTVKYRGPASVVKKESSGGNIEKVN
jgi:hypothetical protein